MKALKLYWAVELEDQTSKIKWIVNGHTLKPYLGENDNITVTPLDDP